MSFWDFLRDSKKLAEGHSHIKNLLEMALADGVFDKAEYELLVSIGKKYNISKKKIDQVKESPEKVESIVAEEPLEKFSQFYDLVQMILADGRIDREEIDLCKVFAKKFGYPLQKVDELIDSIMKNIEASNNAEETFKRVGFLLK